MNLLIASIQTNPVAWLALAVSTVAAGVTIWRSRRDLRRQSSQDYLNASTALLERAYETFDSSRDEKWSGLPRPDRLLWLTVARMLIESEQTAERIKESSHQVLYEKSQEFWRGKLVDLLRPLQDVPLTYFAESADSIVFSGGDQRMCISPKSLRVILDFIDWPKDKSDPIKDAPPFSEHEIDRIRTFRYRSVGDYLDATDAMLRGEESRKTYWRGEWKQASSKSGVKVL